MTDITDLLAKAGNVTYLSRLPATIPERRCLVHNHVRPAHPLGMNGFRAWLQDPDPSRLEICDCGWAPELDQHYRVPFGVRVAV